MLSDWHEFYALLGTAAAALVALLFVAVSIGDERADSRHCRAGQHRTYMSPVVFHYANILFLSLIALIPTQTWESFGLVHRCRLDRQRRLFARHRGPRAPQLHLRPRRPFCLWRRARAFATRPGWYRRGFILKEHARGP